MPFATALFIPGKWRNWAFETEPQPGLNGRRGYQPRGRMLGGSSGLNAMIYIRGHASDYDDWAAQGARGLVVRRRAALLQARRGQRASRRRPARQRRPAQCRRPGQPQSAQPGVPRRLRPASAGAQRRFQRCGARGRRPLSGDAEERRALERGARLPAAGSAHPAESAHRYRNARARIALDGRRATGVVCRRGKADRNHQRPPRRHPLSRHLPVTPTAPAVRHRPA